MEVVDSLLFVAVADAVAVVAVLLGAHGSCWVLSTSIIDALSLEAFLADADNVGSEEAVSLEDSEEDPEEEADEEEGME